MEAKNCNININALFFMYIFIYEKPFSTIMLNDISIKPAALWANYIYLLIQVLL